MPVDNKTRILRNTVFLYIRSILTLLINLYISRLILKALGIEEFGVYQLVGGIVSALSFLNSTMTNASQRFISYAIGKGDEKEVHRTFCATINIMILFAIILFIIIMLGGSFLLEHQLDLGNVNIGTARWILLFSILTLVVTIISVPYNSMLVANEDMKYFAYLDVSNAVCKLALVFSLFLFLENRLVLYAMFMFFISLAYRVIYARICKKRYSAAYYEFVVDKQLLKKILSFSGWTSVSSFSYIVRTQGLAIILNSYFGPILNASYGIAQQVEHAVRTFTQNFQMSYSPKITKFYAIGDIPRMKKLIYTGAKFSTVIVAVIAIPLIVETEFILNIWLSKYPQYTPSLVRIILMQSIIVAMGCNSNTAIMATGSVKWNEIISNSIELLIIPLSFILLNCSANVYGPFLISTILLFLIVVIKIFILDRLIDGFSKKEYLKGVMLKFLVILSFSLVLPVIMVMKMETGFLRFVCTTLVFESIFCISMYRIYLYSYERDIIYDLFKKIYLRLKR